MKKVLLVICFILFSFLFIKDSSAATFSLVDSSNCVIAENGKIESCSIAIDVDGTLTATVFPEIRVTLTHADYQSFTAGSDWNVSIISQTSTLITFRAVYKGTSIPSGQTEIFSITVQSNGTPSDPCRITVGLEPPVYSCRRIYQNGGYIYYNSQGQIVSESVFNSECNPKCELKDGVYYGPEGQILDNELAMLNACNSFVCQSYQGPSGTTYYFNKIGNSVSQSSMISSCSCTKIGDTYYKNNMVVAINETDMLIDCYNPVCRSYQGPSGTTYYFGKNGQSVSNEAAMKASCGCQHIGNKYYDANGNETTKVNYIKSCQNPVCVEVEGYYFDSNGNNVTKAQMYKSCYACSEVDGKYYNANGVETTKLNYIKSCQNPKCDEVDGYYFDSNGNNVTEAQMLKSCNACKEENGKYYDSNGVETTKVNYIMSCQSPKCSYIDGYYFDKDGHNVTEAQMRKSCFSCKEENGIYYNSDGVQTTKINYIISCQNPKCTEYDGYYFDKDGNQVADAAAVIQSCDNPKCMKIDDNTYFDKNGNRVNSLEAYAKSCLVCQQYEDKYIKKDGTITEDVNEYILSCN